ncbi:MAG: hypothetical protein ACREDX_01145 [Aestuariivirga sp.]
MNSASKEQSKTSRQRLSPELNEFLHMLTALETQLSAPQPSSNR